MLPLKIQRAFACLVAVVTGVSGVPLSKRGVIGHNAVVGFPEQVPPGITGELYLKYKPYLEVFNGCVPFPAVEADGDTGGGLKPTGAPNGGCSSSPGQVYARSAYYADMYAIMYAWYMPKDSPSSGLGHRHDWEHAVVWLSGASANATVLGVAVSQHGGHQTTTEPRLRGTSPLIGYISYWPLNHQMIFTSKVGGQQPLVGWESLTEKAREALIATDFGSANVPLKDANFESRLESALP